MLLDMFEDAFIIFIEVICCKIFFETFATKRQSRKYASRITMAGLFCIIFLLSYLLAEHFIWKEIMIVVLTGFIMPWYLYIRIGKSMLISVLYQSLILVVDYCGFSAINYLLFHFRGLPEQYLVGEKLIIIFCKTCLLLVTLIISRKMKNKLSEALEDREWIRFIFFPIFTVGIIATMIAEFPYVNDTRQANVLFMMAFGFVGMDIGVIFLLYDILSREKKMREEKLFFLEARNQTSMYRSISQNFDKQRKKTHEYKNQIICIQGLLRQKEYEKAAEYVENLSGGFNLEMDLINTNHAIINAIINTKYQEAVKKDIVFVIKVNDLSKLWIKDADIVVILSNLLDNAIEAVEKCKINRVIALKMVLEEELILSVKNTYAKKPEILDGKWQTKKEGKEEHGIGVQNIIEIIKKYNGSYTIKDRENELLFSVLIPK